MVKADRCVCGGFKAEAVAPSKDLQTLEQLYEVSSKVLERKADADGAASIKDFAELKMEVCLRASSLQLGDKRREVFQEAETKLLLIIAKVTALTERLALLLVPTL